MRNKKLIPFEVIEKAVAGEPEAVDAVLRHYAGRIIAIFKIKAYSRMNGTNLHSPVELQPEMHAESHLEEHPMSLL